MTHACALFAANALTALRRADIKGKTSNDAPLVPDVYFSWDETEGDLSVETVSVPGGLLKITARVKKAPRWFALNVNLGPGAFKPGDVIGLIAETGGGDSLTLTPRIRSSNGPDREDTTLTEELRFDGTHQVQTLLHTVESEDPLTWMHGYHTLILPLPKQDFSLEIRDLRLVIVDAERGLRAATPGLSSFA